MDASVIGVQSLNKLCYSFQELRTENMREQGVKKYKTIYLKINKELLL